MNIRNFEPGDEAAQVEIYNEAAGSLPRFKAAGVEDVRRRTSAADFDPATRVYAVEDGRPVGYATFQTNGRVGYPWCRRGKEQFAEPLLACILDRMKARGINCAFATYRSDWLEQNRFLEKNGFHPAREMVNFVLDLPEGVSQSTHAFSPVARTEVLAIKKLGTGLLRELQPVDLEKYWLHNPYFAADNFFALRGLANGRLKAVGILIANPLYADPHQVDSNMPCFRLGAFGTEGLTHKRINGMFSFLAAAGEDCPACGSDLLTHSMTMARKLGLKSLAAQAPSDADAYMRFYNRNFREQGRFPILERNL
jgi:hypothetical protein